MFTPGLVAATPSRAPGMSWPQPWGAQTTPGISESLSSTGRLMLPTLDDISALPPWLRPRLWASSGCTCKVQSVGPLDQRLDVVHPAVVGAQVPPADEDQWAGGPCPGAPACAGCRRPIASGASSILAEGVSSTSGTLGCRWPRSMPWGLSMSLARLMPPGLRPNQSPWQPVRSIRSSSRSWPGSPSRRANSSSTVLRDKGGALGRNGLLQGASDNRFPPGPYGRRQRPGRPGPGPSSAGSPICPFHRRALGSPGLNNWPRCARQRRRTPGHNGWWTQRTSWRQHDVGVTGRLVQVKNQYRPRKSSEAMALVQAVGVGAGQGRVAGAGDQGL